MDWFARLTQCLAPYYPADHESDIVGYLRGSASTATWRTMLSHRPQMLVLGNVPPSRNQWIAAGVADRYPEATIRLDEMAGWGVVYVGFMYRPWGSLVPLSDPRFGQYADQLERWRRNDNPAWHVYG